MDLGSIFELSSYDVVLLGLLLVVIYRWWTREEVQMPTPPPSLPPLPMSDMTLEELKKYDGVQDEHILFALNGTIYDVSRGRGFYGPGASYGKLAGHDATRALSKMDVNAVSEEWDDHEGLDAGEKETALEWEASFKFKYATVGKLVKTEKDKTDYEGKVSGIAA